MSKQSKQPDWILSEEWGISRDPYNWTLVYRPHDAKSDRWHAKGHWGKVEQLIEGWYRHMSMNAEAEPELMDHITKCSRDVSEAAERLALQMAEDERLKNRENDLLFIIEAKKAVIEDGRRLTRELDKACFGEDAAEQAALADLVKVIPEEMKKLKQIRELIEKYGEIDGAHHKQWVLTEIIKLLVPDFDAWNVEMQAGEDGPETYSPWDEGIAP